MPSCLVNVSRKSPSGAVRTYRDTSGLEAVHKLAVVDQVRISRALVKLRRFPSLRVLIDRLRGNSGFFGGKAIRLLRCLSLLLHTAADVLQVWRIAGLDDIVSCEH